MKAKKPNARTGVKNTLARLFTAGAGSVVVATTVIAVPAGASQGPSSRPVLQRAGDVRAKLTAADPAKQAKDTAAPELAWWRNWGNGGWAPHPYWHNWPNWRNWHNWGNF